MAKVTIGGEVYEVPPLNFKGIKKVWPAVSRVAEKANSGEPMTTEDGLESVDVAIAVVAAGFQREHPDRNEEWIEDRLRGDEIADLQIAMQEIMIESGIMQKVSDTPGEAPAPTEMPSTGIGTN